MSEALDATLTALFTALADPTRRDILELLRSERCRPGEIAEALGVSRTALSRHLRVLRQAGLISEEVDATDARSRLLRLDPAPLAGVRGWLDEVSHFWTGQLGAFVAHTEGRAEAETEARPAKKKAAQKRTTGPAANARRRRR